MKTWLSQESLIWHQHDGTHRLYYRETCKPACAEHNFWAIRRSQPVQVDQLYPLFVSSEVFGILQTLRQALDNSGLVSVRIVAADEKWEISTDILADSDLANDVDTVGYVSWNSSMTN